MPDDAHEADALARRAAQVVGQSERPSGTHGGDLAVRRSLAAQLEPALEEHAQPGGADRVAEGLEAAVGIDRQLAVAVERARQHLLPRRAPLGEAQVLHEDELGRREAVVHLGHGQLRPGVGDAGLGVGVGGRAYDLLEGRVVVLRGRWDPAAGPATKASAFTYKGLSQYLWASSTRQMMAAAEPSLTPLQSKTPRSPGHQRRLGDRLHGDFLLELGPWVTRPVLVVLEGDPAHDLLHLVLVHAVLVGVGRGQEGEGGRRRQAGVGAVTDGADAGQPRVPGVLELLDADGHGGVVGARGHGVAGVAEGLRAGGAVVLDPGNGLVVDLQRAGQRRAADARGHGAQPEGIDVGQLEAGDRGDGLGGGVGQEVVDPLVPQLAETSAAHADDGHLVADAPAAHRLTLLALVSAARSTAGRAFQK